MIPTDPRADYGPSVQNQINKFVFSGGYELPIGQKKPWLSGLTGVGGKVASGWQVNDVELAGAGNH